MKQLTFNKRARFDYTIEDTLTVGLVLFGHEVKSCRIGQGRIADAIIRVDTEALWIINMDIPLYPKTSPLLPYQPKRPRKLLATKQQIARLREKTHKRAGTILPLELFLDKNNRLKLTIGLGTLNKSYDKKAKIKEKDTQKLVQQELKRMR